MRCIENRMRRRGTPVVYRRPHTLTVGASRGKGSRSPASLRAQTAAAAGETALVLHAVQDVSGQWREIALDGEVWKGLVVTIAGTEYALATDAEVSDHRLSISLASPLSDAVALEEEIQISPNLEFSEDLSGAPLLALVGQQWTIESPESGRPMSYATLSLLRHLAPFGEPMIGHRIQVPERGISGRISEISSARPWGWKVSLEAA